MLGFGGSVASLKATLTLDDDGFIRGMADASAKLDAYNAKLKEEGVSKRLSTMASKDYARQLYTEARQVDQAAQSHGRLLSMLQRGQTHWKALAAGAVGASVGIVALTGHLGTLLGVAGQMGTALTAGLIAPFTSLAAILVGLAGPLSALVTLFGAVGGGAAFGLYSALTSNNKAFNDLQNRVGNMKHMFGDLGNALGQRFLPYIMGGVTWIEKFIKYADQLSSMSLVGAIHSISTTGMAMLNHLNRAIYDTIGRPLMTIFSDSFHKAGNRISASFAHILSVWAPLAGRMWGIFARWFDKQHFTQIGASWAAAIVGTAMPVIVHGLWTSIKAVFSDESAWGKLGMVAGAAFAASFFTRGLLAKGLLAGGKGLIGLFGGGAAGAAGGVGAGEAALGGGAAAGGGILAGVSVGAIAAAVVPVAMIAAEAYASSHASRLTPAQRYHQIYPNGQTTAPTGEAAFGQARFAHLISSDLRDAAAAGENYLKVLKRIQPEEKALNQFISDGGKSVDGWKKAMQQATNQGSSATKAIHGLAKDGFISASQAASDSKATLQQFIGQMDSVAQKATSASRNTSRFGAATRAQYAHVAALARTSAQLASAIDSIPSQKYVSLVLSITENLRSQGNAPGQGRGIGASGGIVTGGTPNQDSVKALLMPGEVVLSKPAVQMLGGPVAANSLNPNGGYIHMANGGAVLDYSGGVPAGKVRSTWGFTPPKKLDEIETHAIKHALAERQKALQKAKTPKARLAAWTAYNHAVDQAKLARRGGLRAAGENYYNRVQTNIGNWIGLEQSSQDPNMNATLSAMYGRELSFIQGGLSWARKHGFNESQWLWDARNLENTITSQKQQQSQASAQEIASFLSTQQGFINEFASNIILPGAQAVLSGATSATGIGSGGAAGPRTVNRTLPSSGGVTIHNHFTQTPPDSFVHIRKAKLQAEAVWA